MLTDPTAPIVRFRGVSKSFGQFVALHQLDLDVMRGEFLTLLGPSGSGKTTTLMLLAGFEAASSGTIELEGQRIEALPAHQRGIGVVFQNYALFPHMSAAENIAFPLRVRGLAKSTIEAEVKRALATIHLSDKGDRKPSQLSGGQQQRVALARAMVFKPKLIVLDEPLGALDKNLREQMQVELKALHQMIGITMVFVTHDQAEALTMSDRVAVFNNGRIEQLDTPEGLYRAPATPFVARFIGENNLIEGTVEQADAHSALIRVGEGGTLRANIAGGDIRPGAFVQIGIRPENISLTSPSELGSFAARVTQAIYLGDSHRVEIDVDGIGRLKVKVSDGNADGIPPPGTAIGVRLEEKAFRILPGDRCA